MSKYQLDKLCVIISGASSGIGFALSELLIKKYSATVIGTGRSNEKLVKAKNALGEAFIPFQMDVSIESEWQKFAKFLTEKNLLPDALINNAGFLPPFLKTLNTKGELIKKLFETDFWASVYSIEYILPLLKKSDRSAVINISSASALCPVPGCGAYSAAKSALKAFTEAIAIEEKNLYTALVLPGFCDTAIFAPQRASDEEMKVIRKFSMSPSKCAAKILKKLKRKKKRFCIGADAKAMDILYRIMPKAAPKIIAHFLKKAKLKVFENTFDY